MTGFPTTALSLLVSPVTGGPLTLVSGDTDVAGRIQDGLVTDAAGTEFPIEAGILRLLVPGQLLEVEADERHARDKEAKVYDARLAARHYREVLPFLSFIDPRKNDTVLELACGTGRVTKELARQVRTLIATDFSYASLIEAAANVTEGNVAFVEADSTVFPGKEGAFSLIVSAQFIEHIPTAPRREEFVDRLAHLLATGGRTVHSLYHHDLRRRLSGRLQEGKHANGVYYRYFIGSEIRTLFAKRFAHTNVKYLDIVLPGTMNIFRSERILGLISRVASYTPLATLAHLVVVRAVLGMVTYDVGRLFRTRWIWFADPYEVKGVDEVVFLSYTDGAYEGFRKKVGMTSVIDLTKSEEVLWEGMRKSFVRKQVRRGEDAGIRVREGTLEEFLPLYRSLQKLKQFPASAVRDAARVGTVMVVERDDTILAGGLFLGDAVRVRAYALASARFSKEGGQFREQVGYASRMLLWEAMRAYRAKGCQTLDLGGIKPDGSDEDRALAEFKEAFGGERVPYFFFRKTYSPLLTFFRSLRTL